MRQYSAEYIYRLRPSVRPSVCLSLRLFPLHLLKRLTFELEILCVFWGHNHSVPGIEGLTLILDQGQFCSSLSLKFFILSL